MYPTLDIKLACLGLCKILQQVDVSNLGSPICPNVGRLSNEGCFYTFVLEVLDLIGQVHNCVVN